MKKMLFSSSSKMGEMTPHFAMMRRPTPTPPPTIIRTPTLSITKIIIDSDDAKIQTYFKTSKFKTHIALYNTWPDVNNAEKEMMHRIVHACNIISVGVILINNDGTICTNHGLTNMHLNKIPKEFISFVLSLHYDSPKTTLHHTLHALWNPLNFMVGDNHIQNIKSFDGYLSCHSDPIDTVIQKYARGNIIGILNHTLSSPILEVSAEFSNNITCFYVGINWEQLNDKFPSRQMVLDLLKKLDNHVSIYGPRLLLNVNVWKNWNQYKGEIPFDGVSIIHAIKKCGVCLVLSSSSHMKFEIASTRLFEGLAAGVPLICDNHPFIKKWFGDNVFYIDVHAPTCHEQVMCHLKFIKDPINSEVVIHKLKECRNVFLTNFVMHHQIEKIINHIKQL